LGLDVVVSALTSMSERSRVGFSIAPLHGGITNRNYRVRLDDGREWVARLPGERTELLGIDRGGEAEAARRAAALGVGPGVVGELPGVGTLVTELVPGSHETFTHHRLFAVVALLQRFHASGPLDHGFPIFRVVEWHARDAEQHGVTPPPIWQRLHEASTRIEAVFSSLSEPDVPCHNDLLPGNVLFAPDRAWLLDYEYAGMNSRWFDLGNLSVNSAFDKGLDDALLLAYLGSVTDADRARLALMKIMSEIREGMWAVVQQAISTLDTDFASYANERLANAELLVHSPAFAEQLTLATT
jgi:thiamine kinase-like enzyme